MPDCTTCQPINTCREALDRYSLQDNLYLFVLNCPPGVFCEGVDTVSLIACDGTEMRVTLPEHILAVERERILTAMVQEAIRRLPFCDDPPEPPAVCPSEANCPETPINTGGGGGTGGGVDPGRNDPIQYYYSGPQVGRAVCPDGSITYFPVPAGRYLTTSLEESNALAKLFANTQAALQKICLSELVDDEFCLDAAMSFQITALSPTPRSSYSWSITSGALPAGVTMQTGWVNGIKTTISGTPTAGGLFTFTVMAAASNGIYAQKTYTIKITGITTASPLPDANEGSNYSETLAATAGATPPLSWQITAGALPAGLSLNEGTGEISGTPTESGDFAFTVTLQTEAT